MPDQQACLLTWWPAAWWADWLTGRLTGVKGWLAVSVDGLLAAFIIHPLYLMMWVKLSSNQLGPQTGRHAAVSKAPKLQPAAIQHRLQHQQNPNIL